MEARSDLRLLTVKEACRLLNVSRSLLWKARKRGELRAVYLGRAVRFRLSDLEAWLEQKAADTLQR
ncbi:helix-turn-helix transcriptional regulator [Rhodothermus marinus]|uniref:Phage transcriptional regulator, AlpA n=1 Tax=Rhodothermus marinus (strain ATCC 43812 / DSM 4252 / R-10) TaxID=518766 RepID=D0MD56_RHOM4|nr:helix-turn-helix domain-containing protein [Rhodothermus marinus]ACY48968.1 phage transcriptional regulator, AlpA [Rhodothermus marinus DSM 4252]